VLPLTGVLGNANETLDQVEALSPGEVLFQNYERFYACDPVGLTAPDDVLRGICLRLWDDLPKWELSDPYVNSTRPHGKDLCESSSPFNVLPWDEPTPDFWDEHMLSRKLRLIWHLELLDDLRAYHGLDHTVELCSMIASSAALEIQMHVRRLPYAVNVLLGLPPHPRRRSIFPSTDFSARRPMMMRYAVLPA